MPLFGNHANPPALWGDSPELDLRLRGCGMRAEKYYEAREDLRKGVNDSSITRIVAILRPTLDGNPTPERSPHLFRPIMFPVKPLLEGETGSPP